MLHITESGSYLEMGTVVPSLKMIRFLSGSKETILHLYSVLLFPVCFLIYAPVQKYLRIGDRDT